MDASLTAAIDALHAEGAAAAGALAGAPLRALALRVLAEPDAERKAALTFAIAAAHERGLLSLDASGADASAAVPDRPARPAGVTLVAPLRVKSSTRRHMLHSLVHAESYAIDLAWDLIARFGWSSELWGPPREDAEGDAVKGATGVDGGAAKGIGGGNGVREAAAAAAPRLPDSFFSSWVTVAAEEAKHFSRWRLRLLAAHATRYGDLPGHEGLWQSALDTRSSLLARLSVVHCVHEARGLDVAPLMRKKLGDDDASVAVLDGNVEEEVGHVREGRRWIEYVCEKVVVPAADPRRVYQACVRRFFYGRVCGPFAVENRNRAGLTVAWYGPLAHEGVPRDVEELTAADMG